MGNLVFISYAREDRSYVEKLDNFLKRRGIACWYDSGIHAGQEWAREIEHRIDECSAFLTVMTPVSVDKEMVRAEISRAKRKLKDILPLRLVDVDPPLILELLQIEDVVGGTMPSDAFIESLRQAVERAAANPAPPARSSSGSAPVQRPSPSVTRPTTPAAKPTAPAPAKRPAITRPGPTPTARQRRQRLAATRLVHSAAEALADADAAQYGSGFSLGRLVPGRDGRVQRRLKAIAAAVSAIEENYTGLSDDELRALTETYRERYADGESLDDLLPEAFATVREAARRVLNQRPYDVQLEGAAALHFGHITEMKTGEGKTLTAVLPAYLNALAGKGVHMVTVNDYLAKRDAEWMGQVHHFLGLTVGLIAPNRPSAEHRAAYQCDITYGTSNDFGFDYLRDNMAWSKDELVQRGHFFAIVDEVDSILLDEARTPLLITSPAQTSQRWYGEFSRVVARLAKGDDYEVDDVKRTVAITERGVARVEDWLGIDNLYESLNTALVAYLTNALRAKELYKRDRDYLVRNGEVLILDEVTGRVLQNRRYNEGMHQSIEAKEGLEISADTETLAKVTLLNYFRLYQKLAGMTATAVEASVEFHSLYGVGVVPIPTHRPLVRTDKRDLIYKTEKAKFNAVVQDVVDRHRTGQPVLVGTVSVEDSEILSQMLRRRGIPHSVLNAKYEAKEAEIVAQAGRLGAVTVSTMMAGRGTDILLGGNPEFLAAAELRNRGIDPNDDPDEYAAALKDAIPRWRRHCDEEAEEVVEAGGLYVLGTERHESRRIDNQLRGRSGRQGDPGESRFYLSLQDGLMKRFRSGAVEAVMERLNIPEDVPIESKMVTRQIRSAQAQIEDQNVDYLRETIKYDDVLDKQRQVIYAERRRVLDGDDLHEQVANMIDDVVTSYVVPATVHPDAAEWDLKQLWTNLKIVYPVSPTVRQIEAEVGGRGRLDQDFLLQRLIDDAQASYRARELDLGPEVLRELERRVLLEVIDRQWREHLDELAGLMDALRAATLPKRSALAEYQRAGFDMFNDMMKDLKEEAVGFLFNLQVQVEQSPAVAIGAAPLRLAGAGLTPSPRRAIQQLQYSAPTIDGAPPGEGIPAIEAGPAASEQPTE